MSEDTMHPYTPGTPLAVFFDAANEPGEWLRDWEAEVRFRAVDPAKLGTQVQLDGDFNIAAGIAAVMAPLQAENERLRGIIAQIEQYSDKFKQAQSEGFDVWLSNRDVENGAIAWDEGANAIALQKAGPGYEVRNPYRPRTATAKEAWS